MIQSLVSKIIIEINGEIIEEQFMSEITIKALIVKAEYGALNQRVIDLSSGQVIVEQVNN